VQFIKRIWRAGKFIKITWKSNHGLSTPIFYYRTLDPTKIITDDKRFRFSFVGISDIISFDPNQSNPFHLVNHYQQVSDFFHTYAIGDVQK
jgi:hypothetical protein